jgi:glycosyltransferase involved in cell wall biosynthesis
VSTQNKIKVLAVTDYLGRSNINPIRPEAAQLIGLQRSALVEVTVMCSPESVLVDYYRGNGIRVTPYKIDRKLSWQAMRHLRKEIREQDYDIIHLFHSRAISNGAMAAIGLPVKVVAYRGQTGSIKRYDPFSYLNMLHPRIDKIICVAKAVEADLRKQMWGAGKKLTTIYKGHDLSWYSRPPAELSGLGLPANAFSVSLVANLRPRKGLPVLLQATHYLPPELPLHILLVGAKPDDPKVQELIATAAFPERVHALGYRDDAPEVSGASDLVVLPTTKREGLSRAILEGMAYGRPAVVTDTGGNAELVADGESGYVVPPSDPQALAAAIEKMWANPDRCKYFGAAARTRIKDTFNVEQGVQKTLRVYQDLLAD